MSFANYLYETSVQARPAIVKEVVHTLKQKFQDQALQGYCECGFYLGKHSPEITDEVLKEIREMGFVVELKTDNLSGCKYIASWGK